MKRPSLAAIEQRIQDIIATVYGETFNYEDHHFIFHMGDADDAAQVVSSVSIVFGETVNKYGQERIAPCQAHYLGAWATPRTLAKAIRDNWKESGLD